jgi:hypothetical protein
MVTSPALPMLVKRLVANLEAVAVDGARKAALEIYASLDPVADPEIAAQLQAMCETCIFALGDGQQERLTGALQLARSVRDALASRSPVMGSLHPLQSGKPARRQSRMRVSSVR